VVYGAAREAIRNAARHGRGEEPGRSLRLSVSAAWQDGLEIRVEDDGIGVEPERDGAGGGQGLALHGTMIGVIGGTMAVEAAAGGGTRVTLSLPAGGTGQPSVLPA
jgi:signal transduction histidine kinase